MIPLSIAPMMDRTDRHFRTVMRSITRHTLLYTEMITTGAILHGDRERFLGYDDVQHPLALQLGGDDPVALAECARIAEGYGYDEINLNVGCPSPRVQRGSFGACLMKTPEVVARAVEAMRGVVSVPVTVKHRIGVDELDRYEDMLNFVDVVSQSGCTHFTVHARKAWLQGLSPKENRNIPPLRYHEVHQLKAERPHLSIEINGGIRSLDVTMAQLEHVDAVMIGRAAVDDPWLFADADARVFGGEAIATSRHEVALSMIDRVEALNAAGQPSHRITRHLLNLFAGQPGARAWKRVLTEGGRRPGGEVIREALEAIDRVRANTPPARLAS